MTSRHCPTTLFAKKVKKSFFPLFEEEKILGRSGGLFLVQRSLLFVFLTAGAVMVFYLYWNGQPQCWHR